MSTNMTGLTIETPRKSVFTQLKSCDDCFVCGSSAKGNLRLLHNAALKAKYLSVIKQAFLIELSADFDYKVCGHCIKRMHQVGHFCHYLNINMNSKVGSFLAVVHLA